MTGNKLLLLSIAFFLTALLGDAKPLDAVSRDEAAIAAHIKLLRDEKSAVRAAAAEALRLLVAKYPSRSVYIRTKDGGEAFWNDKVKQVKPGMTRAQVLKILPHFPATGAGGNMASGQRNTDWYPLDYHWDISVLYDNGMNDNGEDDRASEYPPRLTRRAVRVNVEPPKNYTGTWITWYINGQKGYESNYRNGEYNGAHTHFHDNGQKIYEYLYKNHVRDGPAAGWHRDGTKNYTGQYRNGVEDGHWLRWHDNGKMQSDATYVNGKYDGGHITWYENGQMNHLQNYRNGIKHGLEAKWDKDGIQHAKRYYENGNIVFP